MDIFVGCFLGVFFFFQMTVQVQEPVGADMESWVGLHSLQLDFRIHIFHKAVKMALRCIFSVNSGLSGFKL